MIYSIYLDLTLCIFSGKVYIFASNDGSEDYENESVTGRNKRPPHSKLGSSRRGKSLSAFNSSLGSSCHSNIVSLTDTSDMWEFCLVGSPHSVSSKWAIIPTTITEKSTRDYSEWNKLKVPSHWQLNNFDIPIYTNTTYPFEFAPPVASRTGVWTPTLCDEGLGGSSGGKSILHPKEIGPNTTGLYRRSFQLPPDWNASLVSSSSRFFLVFNGVDSSLTVYLNSHYIGYSQDSCLPAEFEITEYLADCDRDDAALQASPHKTHSSNCTQDTSSAAMAKDRADESPPRTHWLFAEVTRWCDGSYVEDQDKWRLSGIYRDVYILRKPRKCFIADYDIKYIIDFSDDEISRSEAQSLPVPVRAKEATVRVKVALEYPIESYSEVSKTVRVNVIIRERGDENGLILASGLMEGFVHDDTASPRYSADACVKNGYSELRSRNAKSSPPVYRQSWVNLKVAVKDPILWDADNPYLYSLTIDLADGLESEPFDQESTSIGFRQVEISGKDNVLRVNKQRVILAGVNHHEFDTLLGRVVTRESMMSDALLIKKYHFNAVRCSHYPHHPRWLEVCDEVGLYVIDEANIETHGFQFLGQAVNYLANKESWHDTFLNRCTRMYERDKNHPSVIAWSLGNESGKGRAHELMYKWLKLRDPACLVQYESGGAASNVTDIVCPMYLRPDWCTNKAESDPNKRPVILCEYAHAMGNSGGCMLHYWAYFGHPNYPRMQGGFVWDFVDQGLTCNPPRDNLNQNSSCKQPCYAYGGDFGDIPNTKQFCINGLFDPARAPHPHAFEIAFLQSPIQIFLSSKSELVRISRAAKAKVDLNADSSQFMHAARMIEVYESMLDDNEDSYVTVSISVNWLRFHSVDTGILFSLSAVPAASRSTRDATNSISEDSEISTDYLSSKFNVTRFNFQPILLSQLQDKRNVAINYANMTDSYRYVFCVPFSDMFTFETFDNSQQFNIFDRSASAAAGASPLNGYVSSGAAPAPASALDSVFLSAQVYSSALHFKPLKWENTCCAITSSRIRAQSVDRSGSEIIYKTSFQSSHIDLAFSKFLKLANSKSGHSLSTVSGSETQSKLSPDVLCIESPFVETRAPSPGHTARNEPTIGLESVVFERKLCSRKSIVSIPLSGDDSPRSRASATSCAEFEVVEISWPATGSTAILSSSTGQIIEWNPVIGALICPYAIVEPIDLCVWRAPTDNDRGGGMISHESRWRAAGYDKLSLSKFKSCHIAGIRKLEDGSIEVDIKWQLLYEGELLLMLGADTLQCSVTYTFTKQGQIKIDLTLDLPYYFPNLPRFGLKWALGGPIEKCTWLGLGPHECYVDRKASAYLDVFSSSIESLHSNYIYPQECGSRLEPRWVLLMAKECSSSSNNSGSTSGCVHISPLLEEPRSTTGSSIISSDSPYTGWSWSASHHSLEDLERALHNHELFSEPSATSEERREDPALSQACGASMDFKPVYVHFDRWMSGVGGYDSWSPNIQTGFQVYPSASKKVGVIMEFIQF